MVTTKGQQQVQVIHLNILNNTFNIKAIIRNIIPNIAPIIKIMTTATTKTIIIAINATTNTRPKGKPIKIMNNAMIIHKTMSITRQARYSTYSLNPTGVSIFLCKR